MQLTEGTLCMSGRTIIRCSFCSIGIPWRTILLWYHVFFRWGLQQWSIKIGIAWFLCRLSNNILAYGRWRNIMFGYICLSAVTVVIVFFASCPVENFINDRILTSESSPPNGTIPLIWTYAESGGCRWNIQVIVPAVINVVADAVLFIYPFPLIFMAKLPPSLRYSLLGLFAVFGFVTASAIVRVVLMTAGGFLQKADISLYFQYLVLLM